MRAVRAALLFLSRVPLPGGAAVRPQDLAAGTAVFPLVGAALGAVLGLLGVGLLRWIDPPLVAAIVLPAGLLLTGAMHEDGLADTADGLGGGWTAERALEIMRDSSIGTYGGAALVSALLIRWAALAELPTERWLVALSVAHGLSRWAAVLLLRLPYARAEGKATIMIAGMQRTHVVVASVLALALAALGGAIGLSALLVAVVIATLAAGWFRARVGGITGDLLGAAVVAVELSVLVLFAAVP